MSHQSRKWQYSLIVALCLGLLVVALGAPTASAAPYPATHLNGFENAADATACPTGVDADTMFGVTRVTSGTGGITSADGAFHATAPTDATAGCNMFSRLGGYSSTFPAAGYTVSVDIYLDTAVSGTTSDRLDWSSAINQPDGNHRRDFVFSIGGNGTGGWVMSASNNAPGWPGNPGRDPLTITTSGWYTFEHVFRDNAGVLAVDMNVRNAGGTLLKSWTLSDPTDTIGTNVGGNRYAWLVTNDFANLPLDNLYRSGAPCTTVCYADAVGGNDANGGTSPADAKKTIQAAIDAVQAGGEVRVLPGTYSETAANRIVLEGLPEQLGGTYQFGLFVKHTAKDGISIIGVTSADVEITDPTATQAIINTNATNNFGYSGIFVEADNVTIAGLEIGPNTPSDNKTIEVLGDAFTFKNSFMNVPAGGSLYFGDWRFDTGTNTSYMLSYEIDNNIFSDGTSVDITSGAGYSGATADKKITNNEFEFSLAQYTASGNTSWPNVSFTGDTTTVPWFVYPMTGATITGNTFNNTAPDGRHIRARGISDDSTFDWESYWDDNTFNKAVIVGPNLFSDVRAYNYACGGYSCNDVRQIGAVIQPEIDHAVNGDTVLVNEGTYPESPTVNKSVTLVSDDGRDVTFIELQTNTNYVHSLLITGADVTVDGFTIVGIDSVCPELAASNIYLNTQPDDVIIKNNRFQVGAIGGCTNGDDGFGIITEYSGNPDVASLTVEDNIFEPLNTAGQRAFYINPSVVDFTFSGNEINGQFDWTAITEAQNNLIEDNTITGTGASAGFGIWGYLDPGLWGTGTFQRNTITGTANAITIYDAEDVTVTHNDLDANGRGVRVMSVVDVDFDQTTIHINRNALTNNTTNGIDNLLDPLIFGSDDIDGMCNWWNHASGPGTVGLGSGDKVSTLVDFTPWLGSSNLDGPCPAPTNVCNVQDSFPLWTDIIGAGMGNPKTHKVSVKVNIPNYTQVTSLYGQMVAKDMGKAKFVRFVMPGAGNYVQVNPITSPFDHAYGNFWYGADLDSKLPTKSVTGQWFLQASGTKGHIPRALVLYPTYNDPNKTYVNIWNTYDAAEAEVYWNTAQAWTQTRVITESIAPPNGPTTFNVELALVDNDKDARPVWVTVEAGGVSVTQKPKNPTNGDQLNLMTFTLKNVPAGTDTITITLYSPSKALDRVEGDSAALVGMRANYVCAPLTQVP